MLVNLIVSAQDGDQTAMLTLIAKFLPIIKKYGVKLDGEDGKSELTVFLIELIQNFRIKGLANCCDGTIVKYFSTCLFREFLRLNTKKQQEHKGLKKMIPQNGLSKTSHRILVVMEMEIIS